MRLATIALCCLLPLLIVACGRRRPTPFSPAELAQGPAGAVRALPVTLKAGDGTRVPGEHGTILVPENRRRSSSTRLVPLSFRRLGPHRPDRTLLHFTGGPGMSNLAHRYPASLLAAYSVVEVGYRGIDSEPRLDCPAVNRALVSPALGSLAARQELADAVAACFGSWQREGIDLAGYQMRDVVEDAEDLRVALGLGRVQLVGDSYGTRLVLYYVDAHPEAIGRAVLVGANPPGHFFWSATDVSTGFAGYQPFFERAFPEYAGRLRLEELCATVLAHAPGRVWGLRLDTERARSMAFLLLFHQRTSSLAFDAFVRAHRHGDYRGLAVLSQLYDLLLPRAFDSWGEFFVKGLVADYDPSRSYAAETTATADRFGSPLGALLFAPPYPDRLFDFRDPLPNLELRSPILILAGNLDFSTPASTSHRELADRYPNQVVQVTLPDRGHVADFWGDGERFGAIVARYLEHGEVPDITAFSPRQPAFARRIGLTHLPLALLAAGVAVVGSLAALVHRLRRRRRAAPGPSGTARG